MNGIAYLFFTNLKNSIKEFFKRPAKIIAALFFAAMLVLVIVSGQMNAPGQSAAFRPAAELSAGILALFSFIFFLTAYQGLSSGASFYSMADVNLLFSCPISSRKILLYGLIRQMGTSLLVGVFLLFQYSWLHRAYGVSIGGLLLILLGYAGVMFCGQLTAMVLYSAAAGNDRRRKTIRSLFFTVLLLSAAGILLPALFKEEALLPAVLAAAGKPWTILIPAAGAMRSIACFALNGNFWQLAAGILLACGYIAVLLAIQSRVNPDFYEDVLKATEISFSAITAKKEGKALEAIPQNVKTGKTGLGSGKDAFFRKHLLEDRRSGFFFLDRMSIGMAVTSIVFSLFLRDTGILPVFLFSTYLQLFTSMTGRWVKELTFPYVYLIPQPPFRKLLSICKENILKIAADAVLVMLPIGLILNAGTAGTLSLILGRIGFGILFMAGNLLVERVFGSMTSRILVMGLYIITMLLLAAPGIVLGAVLGTVLPLEGLAEAAGFGATLVWNLLAAAVIGFLCRNILNCAELNNR